MKPRPVAATSVGGLLSSLQNEWDALMLETFQLRSTLESTRQELSQALYQHDAACRVIARLVKERDQARASLTSAQAALAQRAMTMGGSAAPAASDDADMEAGGSGGECASETDAQRSRHHFNVLYSSFRCFCRFGYD